MRKNDNKEYREKNKEKINKYKREYYQKNKIELKRIRKEYYKENRKKEIAKSKCWQKKNYKKSLEIARNWRKRNPDKVRELCKSWRKRNPEKLKKSLRKSNQKRRNTVKGRLDHRMSTAIYDSLRKRKNCSKWQVLVGYNTEQLKSHLENKFKKGMTWELLLEGKIHIDHIRPICSFKYTNPKQKEFKECWALNNLQPLWAEENLIKNAKYPSV